MTYDIFRTDGRGQVVRQQQQPVPLAPHDVLVAVRTIGLNFRDVYFVKGNRFRPAAEGMIPFSDAAGLVEAVGPAVTRFKVGDRVNSTVLPNWIDGPLTAQGLAVSLGSRGRDGVLAEKIQVHEKELVAIPDSLSDIQAATLPIAALTAWHAVAELKVLGPGDTVVVQTTGGVAVFAIQFAKALGARVIVVSRSDDKLQLARQAGAHDVINSTVTPEWDRQVLALTGGKGAQLVLDMGLTDSLRRSARAAAFEGTVAIIGVVQEETNPLDIYTVMTKNINVRGVETGSRSMFERMSRFIALHHIAPVIDRVFDVAQVDEALTYLNGSPFGKVVLRFAEEAIPVRPALRPAARP